MLLRLALALVLLVPVAASAAPPDTRPTVAVLYFDYSGKDAEMAVLKKGLAQMLISDLSSLDGLRLVERDRIEELLAELKLSQSGKLDAQTAARVGKLLGAKYLVLGSYFDLMQTLRADARVVEVESGRVVSSTGAQGKPQDFLSVEQKLSEAIAKILVGKTTPFKIAPPKALATRTAVRYSRALDAKDRGDKKTAKTELEQVVKEQPDFRLAKLDIDKLMQ